MNPTPFFSLIIPAYNVENFLSDCLMSILDQTFTDYEVILINDGSTDNTSSIIEYHRAKLSNTQVIHQENQGQGLARNKGIDVAKGKYIWFIDADDSITPDALSLLHEELQKSGYPDGIAFTCHVLDVAESPASERTTHPHVGFDEAIEENTYSGKILFQALLNGLLIPLCCNKVFSRTLFTTHQFHFQSGIFFEDIRYNATMLSKAHTVKLIRKDLYVYNQRAGSTMGSVCTDKHIYSIFSALADLKTYLEKENLYQTYKITYGDFYWRQLSFIYDKFILASTIEKNSLFIDELAKSTAALDMDYFSPRGDERSEFPFTILLKLMTENEKNMNEEMEEKLVESFNFPQEFIETYM